MLFSSYRQYSNMLIILKSATLFLLMLLFSYSVISRTPINIARKAISLGERSNLDSNLKLLIN